MAREGEPLRGSWGAPAQNKLFENVGPTSNFLDVSDLLNAPVVASQHSIQMDFNNDGRQALRPAAVVLQQVEGHALR